MSNNEKMLKEGSFKQLVLKLSVPSIIITLVMVIYNIADIYFIGKTNDPNQIAAISLATPVFTIMSGFGTLFGSGASILISNALGANEKDKVKMISSTAFLVSIITGLLFTLIIVLFTDKIAYMLGADESTISYACDYLRIFSFGCAFGIVNMSYANIIRSDGSAIIAMITNVTGSIANIILDAIFIMNFDMGVKGAALATFISNGISFIIILYYVLCKQKSFSINPKYAKFNVLNIVTYGFPMAASNLLMSVSNAISNNLMMSYGSIALSAQSLASKISMIITMSLMGLIIGLQPVYAYSYGAKNKNRLSYLIKKSLILAVSVGLILSIVCYINRGALVSIFINNDEVIEIGKQMMLASIFAGPFAGIFYVCTSFLQTTRNIKYATIVSILDKFVLFIPTIYIMNYLLGMVGIAWSASISMIITMFIASTLSIKCYKKID